MFNKTIICVLFISFCLSNSVNGNDDVKKIVTYHTPEFGLHYVHALHPKETIYSLSKFSGTSVQEIYDINGLGKSAILSVGQELIIPVKNESIVIHKMEANSPNTSFIKVMYQVKKKDNLFQIAKRYFKTDIHTLVDRNNLNGLTISPDQMLHIGWMAIDHSLPVKVNSVLKKELPVEVKQDMIVQQATETVIRPTDSNSVRMDDSSTPQEVVNQTIQEVNNESVTTEVSTGPIQHKYRVVQHTPIRTTEKKSAETVPTKPIAQATINTPTINTPIDTLSVNYSTTESVSSNTTTPALSKQQSNTAEVAATARTVVATADKTEIPDDERIKKRDYPDLSFLSSPHLQTKKGVAMWDKNDNEPLNMFILHNEAQINSYIRIENPMLGRIVLAKVVARLPSNVYDSDVKMVVSSAVATSLGVKDARFLAEMKYIK